jgi:hypothetical protein
MNLISRRAALRGIASIPVMGGATAASYAAGATPETPQARVQRLFGELAAALDDLTPDLHGWIFTSFSRRPPFADWLQGTGFNATGVTYHLEECRQMAPRQIRIERHARIEL